MPPAKNDSKPVVLVVDDDADIRALFKSVLSRDFYVEVAEDGWAALQRLNKRSFDAVVLDMAMPHKSGLAVLTEIRSDKLIKDTPVIVVSAVAPDNDLWAGVKHEWDRYMQKPVSVAELVKNVSAVVGKKPKRGARKVAAKKVAAKKVAGKKVPRPAPRAARAKAVGRAPKAARADSPATPSKLVKRAAAKKPAARKRAR